MHGPEQRYLADIQSGKISDNAQQQAVIQVFQQLYQQLDAEWRYRETWFGRLRHWLNPNYGEPAKGIYLWGGVGIGKTYMMDLFFDTITHTRKLRIHFHRFMLQVHDELQRLQGHADPMQVVARHFSMQAHVICLDEFMVTDITDAMLLAKLLQALFEKQVCLVVTSNVAPDDLYLNGLQRSQFLPAIELLKQQLHVLHLDNVVDYRTRILQQSGTFFTPLNDQAEKNMQQCFDLFGHGDTKTNQAIEIASRPIESIAYAEHVAWFDFNVLCQPPRSQKDYLALAQRFDIILLSNVTAIAENDETTVTYLIKLIDVLYDENITLILSSEVDIDHIYPAGRKLKEFQRTKSRMKQMIAG